MELDIPQIRSSQDGATYEFTKGTFHGVDCGDEAAKWLQQFLKNDTLRLVFHPKELPFTNFTQLMKYKNLRVYNEKPIPVAYQSGTPLNLLSEASLALLNARLGKKVSERSFRTNMVITGEMLFNSFCEIISSLCHKATVWSQSVLSLYLFVHCSDFHFEK